MDARRRPLVDGGRRARPHVAWLCAAAGQWRTIVQARGPGVDPAFDPALVFTAPIWHAATAKALIGRIVHLPAPLVSADGAVAPTLPAPPSVREIIPQARALLESGAAIAGWAQLRADIANRRGTGLRRRATSLPALIAPTRFGRLHYEDFTQNYEPEALDAVGDAVRLVLPAESHLDARRLSETSRPPLLLVETSGDVDGPALRPIAILHDGSSGVEVVNLTLESWTHGKLPPRDALQNLLPRNAAAARLTQDPLADLARRVLTEAAAICAGEPSPNVAQLEQSCDAAGLVTLAAALGRASAGRDPAAALA